MGSLKFLHLKRVIDFLIFGAVDKSHFSRMKNTLLFCKISYSQKHYVQKRPSSVNENTLHLSFASTSLKRSSQFI